MRLFFAIAVLLSVFLNLRPAFSANSIDLPLRVKAAADRIAGVAGQSVCVRVEDSGELDAYLHPLGFIVISNGMLETLKDDSEVAFVIAHELGHKAGGHYNGSIRGAAGPLRNEIEADRYGLNALKAAGYDPAASLRVLSKLRANADASIEERIDALMSAL